MTPENAEVTEQFVRTARSTAKRKSDRASYDVDTVHGILDATFICHVGFVLDGQPFIIPTGYVRIGNVIYVHGSQSNRTFRHILAGGNVCVSVTLVDGLVCARAMFNQGINYRSVVLFGKGTEVDDLATKNEVFHAFAERVLPGRWEKIRQPSESELKGTEHFV